MGDTNYLIIEPFFGGSHKQFIDTLIIFLNRNGVDNHMIETVTLPAKKWHWRARTSALQLYSSISPHGSTNNLVLITSSVMNLAELVALRTDLAMARKYLYFHENQLQYPVRKNQERDFQYGYNQILSTMVADHVLFNSKYNLESFLGSIPTFLKLIPDRKPETKTIVEAVRRKSHVLYYALELPLCTTLLPSPAAIDKRDACCHIVWPHRWEHDKDPELFFRVMEELSVGGYDYKLSVLGESYDESPDIFVKAKEILSAHIVHWGYQSSREDYLNVLSQANVVVSTAKHEFFGVAMLEAVHYGCYPIAPHALVYPEHFPEECLYRTPEQLAKKLRYFCRYPQKTRHLKIDVSSKTMSALEPEYRKHFLPHTNSETSSMVE